MQRKKISIKENSWLAKCGAKVLKVNNVALTIGSTIYLHNASKEELILNKTWLSHELVHVKQYEQLGVIRFLILYLIECVLKGYYNNKYEIEARAKENEFNILTEFEI
jgi:aspartokinase